MKTVTTNANQSEDVQHFLALVQQGYDCWIEAGKFLDHKLRENPAFMDELTDTQQISEEVIRRFLSLGRGELYPKLAWLDGPGIRRLRKMSFAIQQKYVNEPVQLLLGDGQTLNVDVLNLTPEQATQVFSCDDVRSIPSQRAWLEGRKASQAEPKAAPPSGPFVNARGELVIPFAMKLSARDITKYLPEMM